MSTGCNIRLKIISLKPHTLRDADIITPSIITIKYNDLDLRQ